MSAKRAQTNKRKQPSSKKKAQDTQFLDTRTKNDITGVVLIVFGIVLFIAVIAPGNAMLSNIISQALLSAFGVGAYIFPFAFVIWGVVHFVRNQSTNMLRLIIGVCLIVLGIMALFSLFNPSIDAQAPNSLFYENVVVHGGGYVGSAFAWVFLSLFGRTIACVIIVAIILIGFILAGFSISASISFVRNYIAITKEEKATRKEADAAASKPKDEVYLAKPDQYSYEDQQACLPQKDETLLLGSKAPKKGRRKKSVGNSEDETINLKDRAYDETVVLDKGKKGSKTTRKPKSEAKTVSFGLDVSPTEGFSLPPAAIIKTSGAKAQKSNIHECEQVAAHLQKTLEEFSLPAQVVGWLSGPTVTMYKVDLPTGVKLSKLTSLADDIALALAASSVRIAQIPSTSLVGVEIPNKNRSSVLFGDILNTANSAPLELAIGEDVDGNKICVDLAKMPHLLIGGTTGSGKSVAMNAMIMSMLMRTTPSDVRLIIVDPKRVEMSGYNGIPHLYIPVVTEPKEAAAALRWGVVEMERRLKIFENAGARNISIYNKMILDGKLDSEEGETPSKMPYIVIVIDELSDLMMAAGKDIEDSIVRISQLARAAGIHLIIATQRPSSNIVTGMIKANITNRIALLVATGIDSRVILDQSGAEKLIGNGDMLFSKPEWGKPKRVQGCFVSDAEINAVVEHLKSQGSPEYHPEILQVAGSTSASGGAGLAASDDDPLIWEAADAIVNSGIGSTSMLQRRLKVGYARAGRIMDMLEAKGIVGPPDGSHPREVLIDSIEDLEAIKAFEANDLES